MTAYMISTKAVPVHWIVSFSFVFVIVLLYDQAANLSTNLRLGLP
jgi:hypothetical protein